MVYLVHLQQYPLGNIMPDGFKVCLAQQVFDILLTTSKEIVQADDLQKQWLGYV